MSSSDIAISVRGVSKAYTIAHEGERHVTLAEQVLSRVRRPFRRAATETFWALKDVSFDVKKGDVVGIIGRNGAGKSTLLKILSRITEPSGGEIDLYGRVGSLLEVGTGFHPELTGRENVYLNGHILGMRKKEIDKQFDAIVDFAGVEKFLDTPVKRYSSGMYVRLAFAVAAHLQSEILIVDEVLAVGDADFQLRCLGKMRDVAQCGRSVLLVSHNTAAVSRLCHKCLLLRNGKVVTFGETDQLLALYQRCGDGRLGERVWKSAAEAPGDDVCRAVAVRVRSVTTGAVVTHLDVREPFDIEFEYDVIVGSLTLVPVIRLSTPCADPLCFLHEHDLSWRGRARPRGRYTSRVRVPGNLLAEGPLTVGVAVGNHLTPAVHVSDDDVLRVELSDPMEGDSARADYRGAMPGCFRPKLDWVTTLHTPEAR